MKQPRSRIAVYTFLLYALTMAVGIFAAWRQATSGSGSSVTPLDLDTTNLIIFVGVFAVFTTVMVRFARVASVALRIFLLIALLAGAHFIFGAWFAEPIAVIAALALVVLAWALPVVLVHDITVGIGIAGISSLLGLSMTPLVACVLLAALSLYDIISVYRTRHMVTLAGRMMDSGAVFGFLVPAHWRGFLKSRRSALDSREVMMLGSGDIGLPLVLAASTVSVSFNASIVVVACALVGLTLMHWMFAHQEDAAPMAALPPIAMSAILGYLMAVLMGI